MNVIEAENFLLNSLKSKMFLLWYSIAVFLDLFQVADYLEQKVNFWTNVKNGYFNEHFFRNLQKNLQKPDWNVQCFVERAGSSPTLSHSEVNKGLIFSQVPCASGI